MREEYLEYPIFICGHRKAGTTLLINLFDGVEDAVVYPDDSGFFYMYYPYYALGDFNDSQKVERLVDRVARRNLREVIDRVKCSEKDKEILHRKHMSFLNRMKKFDKENFSTKDILLHLIKSYKSEFQPDTQPRRWIEKTTSTEIYATEIKKWFPNAKFIHIVRDPRDNWSSLLSGWDDKYVDYIPSSNHLMHSMIERGLLGFEMAINNAKIIGKDSYRVIRYEDLVSDPKKHLESLSRFASIKYTKNLLEPSTFGLSWKGNNFDGKKFNGISHSSVGKWRERIKVEDAALIEYYFSNAMEEFGYQTSFTLKERQRQAIEHYKWYNFSSEWCEK